MVVREVASPDWVRQPSARRQRLAFLTPLNPPACGIADYSEDLLPYIAEYHDVDVFTSDGLLPTTASVANSFQVRGYSQFSTQVEERPYDQIIVQFGNSPHHIGCYDQFIRHGGIAVLHDLNLSGIIGGKTLARGDTVGFFKEMLSAEGHLATSSALARFLATRRLPGHHDWWMNRMVLKRSSAVVVHNEFAAKAVRLSLAGMGRTTPVWKVPQGVPLLPEQKNIDVGLIRERLGLRGFDFVAGAFGGLDENKRISVALRAFSRLLNLIPGAVFLLVGRDLGGYAQMVESMGLEGRVRLTGHVTMEDFYDYIRACDCCVSLRYPSRGETSAALLRVMSVGKPTAVTNHGQFQEYPDGTCLKINLGQGEADEICAVMYRMATRPELGAAIGRRARRYVEEHHSLRRAAEGYNQVVVSLPSRATIPAR